MRLRKERNWVGVPRDLQPCRTTSPPPAAARVSSPATIGGCRHNSWGLGLGPVGGADKAGPAAILNVDGGSILPF